MAVTAAFSTGVFPDAQDAPKTMQNTKVVSKSEVHPQRDKRKAHASFLLGKVELLSDGGFSGASSLMSDTSKTLTLSRVC